MPSVQCQPPLLLAPLTPSVILLQSALRGHLRHGDPTASAQSRARQKSQPSQAHRDTPEARSSPPLWACCYCVDRLLDSHNPFGDKCADRGRVEPVKVSSDAASGGLLGPVSNMFPHHCSLICALRRSSQMEVE